MSGADASVALLDHRGSARGYANGAAARRIRTVGILCDTVVADDEVGIGRDDGLAIAARALASIGFEAVVDEAHLRLPAYHERWMGTPDERAAHFRRLIEDLGVDCVWPLFGKGGSSEVVDAVHRSGYEPSRPVAFIGGFSQHTDWALWSSSRRRQAFSRVINATQLAYADLLPRANLENVAKVLGRDGELRYDGLEVVSPGPRGPVEGRLIGGNLGVILSNLHQPWMPSLADAVVLVEDYGKHVHELHRQFARIAAVADAAGAAAIVLGGMTPTRPPSSDVSPDARAASERQVRSCLAEVAHRVRVPIYRGAGTWGHGALNFPLYLDARCRLEPCADGRASLINTCPGS